VYALLLDKTQQTYTYLLSTLKTIEPGLKPETIMIDFEEAAINAFEAEFPSADLKGCYFHFTQCLGRKLQTLPQPEHLYTTNSEFALNVRTLAELAFVPVDDVVETYEMLVDSPFFTTNICLHPMLDYVEDKWIERQTIRRRHNPRYRILLWNCFNRTVEGLPRTNNYMEEWHRGFNGSMSCMHPSIFKFIDKLKDEQNLNETKIEQYLSGVSAPLGRRKYVSLEARLHCK